MGSLSSQRDISLSEIPADLDGQGKDQDEKDEDWSEAATKMAVEAKNAKASCTEDIPTSDGIFGLQLCRVSEQEVFESKECHSDTGLNCD